MKSKISVLLIEDNDADVKMIKLALNELKTQVTLKAFSFTVLSNGKDALEYLEEHVIDLIILDLNLVGLDGRELLRIFKSDPSLKDIPVIILTTSKDPYDVAHSYKYDASAFITKPVGYRKFDEMVKDLGKFWLKHNVYKL